MSLVSHRRRQRYLDTETPREELAAEPPDRRSDSPAVMGADTAAGTVIPIDYKAEIKGFRRCPPVCSLPPSPQPPPAIDCPLIDSISLRRLEL
ncbi:unnamed protein product [Gadus morhua 'NCC']